MLILRATVGLLVTTAMVEAMPSFPGATIGNGFMHLPVKRDSQVVETKITNQLELYSVEIEIGTPAQKTYVSIDTGSSELWVNPNCSSVSEDFGQRARCKKVPFFNVAESKTARGPGASEKIVYGSQGEEPTGVKLDMYLDTVVVGSANIASQRLGVTTTAQGLPFGIMGLAPALSGWAINKTYPLLLDNLSLQNITNSRAYSIGLGPMNDSTGSLTFGGIDTKKFSGKLAKQPIVRSVDGKARLTIEYESLSIASPGIGSKTFNVTNKNVMIDSGNTFSKLEASLVSELWNVTGATEGKTSGYPLVDCSVRKLEGGLTFGFSGVNVTAAFSDLVYEVDDICALGVVKVEDGDQQILGDSFMRSAYTVFDLDNKNIHIAQYNNCGSEIITIGSGEDAISSLDGGCSSKSTTSNKVGAASAAALSPRAVLSAVVLTALAMFR